jgi:hypothetical protein
VVVDQRRREPLHALERGAQGRTAMERQRLEQQRADTHQATRSVVQLLGEHV